MATLTIRNLPDDVAAALKVRAQKAGHSMEAEVRDILTKVALPQDRTKLGDVLQELGRMATQRVDEPSQGAR